PQSPSSNTHSISPSTTQQPSNLRAWGKDDDTTAVVTFLRLALLVAHLMLAIGIIVSLCQVHEVIEKFTNVVETSTITTTTTARVTFTDWSAPLITMTKKTKTVTETETQTVVQTGREAIDRMKRRRDRAARKTTVDTVYTPEVTMPIV
ncbi:hypothetical protein D6C88_09894, partial [Aureobasidium pullulans]